MPSLKKKKEESLKACTSKEREGEPVPLALIHSSLLEAVDSFRGPSPALICHPPAALADSPGGMSCLVWGQGEAGGPSGEQCILEVPDVLPCSASVFENSSKIVIVMEYASRGDLYDYISERQQLSERDARHFFRQIVSAVRYCHQVSRYLPSPVLRGGPWAPEAALGQRDSMTSPESHREKQRQDLILDLAYGKLVSGVVESLGWG